MKGSRRIWLGAAAGAGVGILAFTVVFGLGAAPAQMAPVGELPNRVIRGPDRDVPCEELANGQEKCATPLPQLTVAEKARGSALRLDAVSVPLDHVGGYRVLLGQAILARGYVGAMDLSIANLDQNSFKATSFRLLLEDAKSGEGLPFNIYEKGLTQGDQTVNVYLVFDLSAFTEGATVEVRDVFVGS